MQDESKACVGASRLPAAIGDFFQARAAHTTDLVSKSPPNLNVPNRKNANLHAVLHEALLRYDEECFNFACIDLNLGLEESVLHEIAPMVERRT